MAMVVAMARPLRIEYDGALYHVTSRGNERKAIFKDDTDRALFLDILAQVKEHGYSQVEVARHLKLHYTTVSRIIRRVVNVQE
jgi:DNA-binding MarR family transcriptional regulator